jgi:hypothetical protein
MGANVASLVPERNGCLNADSGVKRLAGSAWSRPAINVIKSLGAPTSSRWIAWKCAGAPDNGFVLRLQDPGKFVSEKGVFVALA